MAIDIKRVRERLKQGLEHFDRYSPAPPDDCNILADNVDCLYEFAVAEEDCLRVGDLRNILTILEAL